MAFDFSESEQRCTFYSQGVTSGAGTGRQDVQSYVWRFPRPDGTPPSAANYQQVQGEYLVVKPANSFGDGAMTCFRDGSILFPPISADITAVVAQAMVVNGFVSIGLDDMLEEGVFVRSDYVVSDAEVPWQDDEPNNRRGNQHCTDLFEGQVRDVGCGKARPALCLFVGKNLAQGKPSTLTGHSSDSSVPSRGNDGDTATYLESASHSDGVDKFVIDLGATYQVSSVVFVSRPDCCEQNNRDTSVHVGNHPRNFGGKNAATCVKLEEPFLPRGYARLFRCEVPVTGRYVRVQRPASVGMDFAELGVFGNRLSNSG